MRELVALSSPPGCDGKATGAVVFVDVPMKVCINCDMLSVNRFCDQAGQ